MDQNILKIKQEVVEIEYTPIYNEDHDSKKESICKNISEVEQEIVGEGNSCNLQGKCEWSDTAVCSLGQKAIFLKQCSINKVKQEPDEQENAGLLVSDMEMQFKEEPFTGKTCKREPSEFLPSQELKTDLNPLAQHDCLGMNVYSVKEECTMNNAERNGDHVTIYGENVVDETGYLSYKLELEKIVTDQDLPSTSKITKFRDKWNSHYTCQRKIYSFFICDHCNRAFKSKVKLRHHIAEHLNTKYYLQRHEHNKVMFKHYSNNLNEHSLDEVCRLTTNTGDSQHPCSFCDKRLRSKSELMQHLKLHADKKLIQCPLDKEIHTEHKRYKCPVCEKSFKKNKYLKQHLRIHTGHKPHQCPVCEKSFSQNQDIKRHLLIHTGDKPYRCPVCEKSFGQSSHLQQHLHIHTGDKPYKCLECEKSFRHNGNLKKHLRIHTGEKPYQCQVCEKTFSQNGNLKKHLMIHDRDKL